MSRERTTITLERRKLEEALRLTGAANTSAAIDLALDRLIRTERLRRDVLVYTGSPPTEAELALAEISPPWDELGDDIDWESLYPESE